METNLYKSKIDMTELIQRIEKWAEDRNFFGEGGATQLAQLAKLMEESGELAGNIARGRDVKDDIGDCLVVLTILARLSGTNITECAEIALTDIEPRLGDWVGGVFIKKSDLQTKLQ